MNAIFGMQTNLSIGDQAIIGVMVCGSVFELCIPRVYIPLIHTKFLWYISLSLQYLSRWQTDLFQH